LRLKEKLEKPKAELDKLAAIEKQVFAAPDQQISLTDLDSRSMATGGRSSGVVEEVCVVPGSLGNDVSEARHPHCSHRSRTWRRDGSRFIAARGLRGTGLRTGSVL
jgi:hypothetical protein